MNVYTGVDHGVDYDIRYITGWHKCKSLDELRFFLANWRWVAEDAYQRSQLMDEKRFKKLKSDQKKEAKGQFTGNDDFMVISTPAIMIRVSILRVQFKVPFGMMFNRLRDLGKLKIENNRVVGFVGLGGESCEK